MPTEDPHEWWTKRASEISILMKNTGVGELVIRRKADGKYSFELTPEAEIPPALPTHGKPYEKGRFETVGVKQIRQNSLSSPPTGNNP